MDITPLVEANSKIIQGYGPGSFRISGEVFNTAILIFPDRVEPWNYAGDPASFKEEDFQSLFAHAGDTEVVLLGCGSTMQFVSPALRKVFSGKGLALEAMDTGAACRTYNVLMAEGRLVAAALIPL